MRTTSSVTDTEFPFADDRVPFILVLPNAGPEHRGFEHASHHDKKKALVEQAMQGEAQGGAEVYPSLLAIWPGGTRSDVFHVDNLSEALAAFG